MNAEIRNMQAKNALAARLIDIRFIKVPFFITEFRLQKHSLAPPTPTGVGSVNNAFAMSFIAL